jgi:hypothetical protein
MRPIRRQTAVETPATVCPRTGLKTVALPTREVDRVAVLNRSSSMVTTRARTAILLSSVVFVVAGTAGCSAMQASGRGTRESGESMETY